MKQKKLFNIQTAIQTGCKSPGTLTCVICNKTYMAGNPPSIFVYYELNNCSACSKKYNGKTVRSKKDKSRHTHCAWVCSDMCAELWVIKNSNLWASNRGVK